jgi:hypothetical protein
MFHMPGHEVHVEAEEIDELAGGVDLGLERGLRLAEHRRGVERRAVLAGEKIGSLQEHGRAGFPRQRRPVLLRGQSGLDRGLDLALARLVVHAEHVLVVVRHDAEARFSRADVPSVDDARNVDFLAAELFQLRLELGLLLRAGAVRVDRLVFRHLDLGDACDHRAPPFVHVASLPKEGLCAAGRPLDEKRAEIRSAI